MGGVMSSIVPGVYVGGLTSARSESELNQCQITHICSAFQYPLSLVSLKNSVRFENCFVISPTNYFLPLVRHFIWSPFDIMMIGFNFEFLLTNLANISLFVKQILVSFTPFILCVISSQDPKRVHKQFVIQDSPDEDIAKHFVDAADFIHGARVNHGTVLIHW